MSGAEKATLLGEFVEATWRALERPCSERVIRAALAFAANRAAAFDPARAVLVHGDAHAANALLDAAGEYRLIDPDGLFAEPACDLAVPLREWPREPGARERCARLSELTGVAPQPIWEWGYVERVSTGLAAPAGRPDRPRPRHCSPRPRRSPSSSRARRPRRGSTRATGG